MTYEIIFSEKAFKQLKKLDRALQERIIGSLERIRVRPEIHIKKLVGDLGFRLRVGDYRVIMDIDMENMQIIILKIGHRKSIYF